MEMSFFENGDERDNYLNNIFTMTDSELLNKILNEDGTLKNN